MGENPATGQQTEGKNPKSEKSKRKATTQGFEFSKIEKIKDREDRSSVL